MRKYFSALTILMVILSSCSKENKAKESKKDFIVTIQTTYGDMKVILYDETPLHKENFLELARSGQYDSTIWHRVIENFMIQGGGIDMKNGTNDDKKIDAEIVKGFYHHKGALAAARQGDQVNPKKKSSWCQFYIVQGEVYDSAQLKSMETQMTDRKKGQLFGEVIRRPENADILSAGQEFQREGNRQKVDSLTQIVMGIVERELGPIGFSEEQFKAYSTVGGSPHLDNEYTVFGKVIEGLDVIDRIAAVDKGRGDKPKIDIYIKMSVEELPKKKITKMYGYEYSKSEK
ncbi:peptidylprolyl isomerase [Reichenbachiella versicolor]|uniref:peptidylprolyl isomerase n=1 Tax=Reichenbachiella versicolor TaxID=1821036 RepID=UPI000D6E31D7|nr:peptidylprolyl isomerase [Reichenbachiella versicolor]